MHCHLRLPVPQIVLGFNHEDNNAPAYTKFHQNRAIRRWVIDDSTHFIRQFGLRWAPVSQTWVDQTAPNLEWTWNNHRALRICFRFQIRCSVSKRGRESDSKITEVESRDQVSHFSLPVKIGKGWAIYCLFWGWRSRQWKKIPNFYL